MADNFGKAPASRIQADSSRFYATAVADVPANAIYCPAFATSGLFGIAEVPIKSGDLGAFAREGIFAFDAEDVDGSTFTAGTPVYYTPSSAVAGALSTAEGDIFVGYIVEAPNVTGKVCVLLATNALVPASSGTE